MRPKGRLVAPRQRKKLGRDLRLKRATETAKEKLGNHKFQKLQANYAALSTAVSSDRRKLEDGLIMAALQDNLSFDQIRALFGCGNSRIKRVRNIMGNPKLLDQKTPQPEHAFNKEDIEALKDHISLYETEDGFPCAHRRPRKFFIIEGLT